MMAVWKGAGGDLVLAAWSFRRGIVGLGEKGYFLCACKLPTLLACGQATKIFLFSLAHRPAYQ